MTHTHSCRNPLELNSHQHLLWHQPSSRPTFPVENSHLMLHVSPSRWFGLANSIVPTAPCFLVVRKSRGTPMVAMQTFARQTWQLDKPDCCCCMARMARMARMAALLKGPVWALRHGHTQALSTTQLTVLSHWTHLFRSQPARGTEPLSVGIPTGPGRPRPTCVLLHRSPPRESGHTQLIPHPSHLHYTLGVPSSSLGRRSCLGNYRPPGTNWLSGVSHKPR